MDMVNQKLSLHQRCIFSSKLWEMVKDREAWHSAVHVVAKSRTQFSDWTTTMNNNKGVCVCVCVCISMSVKFKILPSGLWHRHLRLLVKPKWKQMSFSAASIKGLERVSNSLTTWLRNNEMSPSFHPSVPRFYTMKRIQVLSENKKPQTGVYLVTWPELKALHFHFQGKWIWTNP